MTFSDKFFGDYGQFVNKGLNTLAMRQRAIANNIANANTPGYLPVRVAFEDQFKQIIAKEDGEEGEFVELEASDPGHFGKGELTYASFEPTVTHANEQVDIHQEMVDLAKNQMLYNLMVWAEPTGFTKMVIENHNK